MRSVVFAIALTLTAASAGGAQLPISSPPPADTPAPVAAEARVTVPRVDRAPLRRDQVEVRYAAVETSAARELSARSLFTIIGVVVVAIALIALAS